jgi:endonuclease/exonuclease/phosphatase family metal-dependent hydrolase/2'-5' RNA ligase
MRPADVIHAQIRWDARLDARRFTVGIDEHRAAPKVVPFERFVPGGDIPWHRVVYFACDGQPCWDRRTGIDRVDVLAGEGTAGGLELGPLWSGRSPVRFTDGRWSANAHQVGPAPGDELRVLTWNVLWDRFDADRIDSATRWPLLLDAILATDAHVVCLQEVDPAFHALVLDHPDVRADWWVSHGPRHPEIGARDLLLMGRVGVAALGVLPFDAHKGAVAAVLPGERPVVVVTTHLSSNHRDDAARIRARELTQLFAGLADVTHAVVVTGDLNLREEGPVGDLEDAWTTLRPSEPTFEPAVNPLAAIASRSGLPGRLDRVLVRGDAVPTAVRRTGTAPVDGTWLSDHYGVLATLALRDREGVSDAEPSVRSALAWIPPGDLVDVQALRREHDPAYRRWPPHVNVLWGFAEEVRLTDLAPLVARVLAGAAPFQTALDRVDGFGRGPRRTHHLAPAEVDDWRALHTPLARTFPRMVRHPVFQPHLTVARGAEPPALDALVPVEGEVGALVWMTRRGRGPFGVRARFPLGTGTWERLAERDPAGLDVHRDAVADGVVEQLRALFPSERLVVVGSRALGVHHGRSDLDLVLEGPGLAVEAVAARLETIGPAALAVVDKRGVRGIQLVLDRMAVDLAVVAAEDDAEGAARIRAAEQDVAVLRERLAGRLPLVRAVKRWAARHRVDDAALGGLEGLAWAVLVASCDATSLRGFVEHWAAWDWSTPVGDARDPQAQVVVTTPTPPFRNITTRAIRRRVESALLASWEAFETGRPPVPWHQRCGWAVVVGSPDRTVRAALRGRARAVLEAFPAFAPRPTGDGIAFGVVGLEHRTEATQAVRGVLRGLEVAVRWCPSSEVE